MLSFRGFLITEDRVKFVKDQMRSKIAAHADEPGSRTAFGEPYTVDRIFKILEDTDPTPKKIYFQWLCKAFLADPGAVIEDHNIIKEDLRTFERVKARMPAEHRDINRLKDHYELRNAIAPFEETKSNNEIKKEEVAKFKKDIRVLYDGPEGMIAIPETQAASCFLGRGTKWCTAGSSGNMFKYYTKDGPLYVMIHKDGRKWQLHAHSAQIMDEKDTPLSETTIRASSLFQKLKPFVAHEFTKTPSAAIKWARIIGGRFPEGEATIASDANTAYDYALKISGPIPEINKAIAHSKKPLVIFQYALNVLKGRFKEAEPALLDSIPMAISYAKSIIKGRWPELEERLKKAPSFVRTEYENIMSKL